MNLLSPGLVPVNRRRLAAALTAVLASTACLESVQDAVPPTVPQDVVATSPLPARVVVSWSPSTDVWLGVGGYTILRDGGELATVAAEVTSFQDDGVTAATPYAYTVRAFDREDPPNVSEPSALAGVVTLAEPDTAPPTAPGDVSAVALRSGVVLVTWTASTDAGAGVAGYEVRRDGALLASVAAPTTAFEDVTVQASTSYAYAVRALDAAVPPNASSSSAPASATTPAPPDLTSPTVPGGVTALASGTSRVVVSWSASTDEGGAGLAGYEVRRDGALLATVAAPATVFEDLTVRASTTYAYAVRALDAAVPANASADSAPGSATTAAPPAPADLTPPTVPAGVTAVAPGASRVVVSWRASTDQGAGVAGYEVRRGGALLASVAASATSFEDLTVRASTSYAYAVRALDAAVPANASADSALARVKTPKR